jgi:hypothetical protein
VVWRPCRLGSLPITQSPVAMPQVMSPERTLLSSRLTLVSCGSVRTSWSRCKKFVALLHSLTEVMFNLVLWSEFVPQRALGLSKAWFYGCMSVICGF